MNISAQFPVTTHSRQSDDYNVILNPCPLARPLIDIMSLITYCWDHNGPIYYTAIVRWKLT